MNVSVAWADNAFVFGVAVLLEDGMAIIHVACVALIVEWRA